MISSAQRVAALSIFLGLMTSSDTTSADGNIRRMAPNETWEIRNGRFHQNGRWIFLKTGKLIRDFEDPQKADGIIADIDIMIDKLNYNNVSLNIYPNYFDLNADGRIDPDHNRALDGIRCIIDHCWRRGIFCSLSFETYNVGGGGVPDALFKKHPEIVAINALGLPATDVEYRSDDHYSKKIPSIFHPMYLKWSRDFLRNFLKAIGNKRTSRLLYIETTVEPQYLGKCNVDDRDIRRAALDFSDAAGRAFKKWHDALPPNDPGFKACRWPDTQEARDKAIGDKYFNKFRGHALGKWVTGDIRAIRSVAPEVYIAVDYNGRFDDKYNLRVGDHYEFLTAIEGANIIQIAPHGLGYGPFSWDNVCYINKREKKDWAITEHMTMMGQFPEDDKNMTRILDNTLKRGTRWGWELVNISNQRSTDDFAIYDQDWTSPVADVIEGENWRKWLKKIGVEPFVPKPRQSLETLER